MALAFLPGVYPSTTRTAGTSPEAPDGTAQESVHDEFLPFATATALADPGATPTFVPEGSVVDLDPEEVYSMTDPRRPPFALALAPGMGQVTVPTGWNVGLSLGMAIEDGRFVPYTALDFQYKGAVLIVDLQKRTVTTVDVPELADETTRQSVDAILVDMRDGK